MILETGETWVSSCCSPREQALAEERKGRALHEQDWVPALDTSLGHASLNLSDDQSSTQDEQMMDRKGAC
jgi:hypothetical protein